MIRDEGRFRALWAEGLASDVIALRMGMTRNGVNRWARRLDLPARGTTQAMTDLAEHVANGQTVHEAGRNCRLSASAADRVWACICASLGPQAV